MLSNIYFNFLHSYHLWGFIPSFIELMLRVGQLSVGNMVFSLSFDILYCSTS